MPDNPTHGAKLAMQWREGLAIINLRGRPEDAAFLRAAHAALGMMLPVEPVRMAEDGELRIVWAGPDDWFLIGPGGHAQSLLARLRHSLAGLHAAITDVSSGYTVLRLVGAPVREVLAQGCPLDLHPRAFGPDRCAGTHFFKASVWLWRAGGDAAFELLVRRSFRSYVGLMLERGAHECNIEGSLRPAHG